MTVAHKALLRGRLFQEVRAEYFQLLKNLVRDFSPLRPADGRVFAWLDRALGGVMEGIELDEAEEAVVREMVHLLKNTVRTMAATGGESKVAQEAANDVEKVLNDILFRESGVLAA